MFIQRSQQFYKQSDTSQAKSVIQARILPDDALYIVMINNLHFRNDGIIEKGNIQFKSQTDVEEYHEAQKRKNIPLIEQ